MEDAKLAPQIAALATALLQAQQQNQATIGPTLVALQIGGVQDATA